MSHVRGPSRLMSSNNGLHKSAPRAQLIVIASIASQCYAMLRVFRQVSEAVAFQLRRAAPLFLHTKAAARKMLPHQGR